MLGILGIAGKIRSKSQSQLSVIVRLSLLLVATVVGGSCSNGNDESPSQADDIAAISALYASIVPLINSDGADGLFTLYTDDAVLMVPDRWTDLDRQDAHAFYTENFDWAKPNPDDYSISIEEVVVMGDWAYVRQKSLGQNAPTNGDPSYLQGSRHFAILRRQPDGAWKIAREIFHIPPLGDFEMEGNLNPRIASFEQLSGSPVSANLIEYWNCAQREGVTNAQLWEASKTWINVMNSMNPEVKGKVYLEFPRDGRTGVGQFKLILVFENVEAREKYWSDLDDEKVDNADMAFDALASCDNGALVSSLEVTNE
jgi:ketosteroid isomerase-like protein